MKNNRDIILIHNGERYKSRKIIELLYGKKQTSGFSGSDIELNYIETYEYAVRAKDNTCFYVSYQELWVCTPSMYDDPDSPEIKSFNCKSELDKYLIANNLLDVEESEDTDSSFESDSY